MSNPLRALSLSTGLADAAVLAYSPKSFPPRADICGRENLTLLRLNAAPGLWRQQAIECKRRLHSSRRSRSLNLVQGCIARAFLPVALTTVGIIARITWKLKNLSTLSPKSKCVDAHGEYGYRLGVAVVKRQKVLNRVIISINRSPNPN